MSGSATPRAATARVAAGEEPRFSILIPVADPSAALPAASVESLKAQTLRSWEICPAGCGERGVAAALNEALAGARGELVLILHPGDRLEPEALERLAAALDGSPGAELAYGDEDRLGPDGRRGSPFFKPDLSPERLRTQMYVGRGWAGRRPAFESLGGFDEAMEGAHEWDLILRLSERGFPVPHVASVLYSRREAPPADPERAVAAVQAHCDRTGLQARVRSDGAHRATLHLEPALSSHPAVSIVIPTAGRSRAVRGSETVLVTHCVRSIVATSTYDRWEIVCVADASTDPAVLRELREAGGGRLKVVEFDGPFNFSAKVNLGARESGGEHLLLLNDDIEVISPDWLERLLMYSQHEGIGAVGGRLLREDGTLQHAGVVFEDGLAGHVHRDAPPGSVGYADSMITAQNYLAVTAACLMTPRAEFEAVGGFEEELPVNYNDVDYCLKLRERDRRVVYDPDTALHHFESSSRRAGVSRWETRWLRERWGSSIDPDPYSNPGLRYGELRSASPLGRLPGWLRRWLR